MIDRAIPALVDSHCHLYLNNFDNDRDDVIERAFKNGISRILIPGLNIETSQQAINLAYTYNEIFCAVGVHPNEFSSWSNNTIQELMDLASNSKVVAIGEIGLDYYRSYSSKTDQEFIFKQQLELAADLGLPVIIHNRDAFDDIYRILAEWHSNLERSGLELASRPGVLHSFSGDMDFADRMIALNFKLGLSGPITFSKKSEVLQSFVSITPIENFLFETDSPFLTPHPFRGKRNEPANVRIVAEKVAEIKGNTLDNIAKISTASANQLFRWSNNP